MTYSCYSVAGGWQTFNQTTNQLIGPAFHRVQDLWNWQRNNLR